MVFTNPCVLERFKNLWRKEEKRPRSRWEGSGHRSLGRWPLGFLCGIEVWNHTPRAAVLLILMNARHGCRCISWLCRLPQIQQKPELFLLHVQILFMHNVLPPPSCRGFPLGVVDFFTLLTLTLAMWLALTNRAWVVGHCVNSEL